MSELEDAKAEQRSQLRMRLAGQTPNEGQAASLAIVETIKQQLGDRLAGGCMGFLPLPGEPDLRPLLDSLIHSGTTTCVPVVDWDRRTMVPAKLRGLGTDHIREGRHGVCEPSTLEPVDPAALSIVLVPGLGFDATGRRLGRGGGFYDRFLADLDQRILAVGIAFEEQVLKQIETGPTDVPLPMIITEARVIDSGSSLSSPG
jgi:5-formyltetrahydrofolate cyclo-ligase